MKPGLAKSIRFIIFSAVAVLLLWFAFRGISFGKLIDILATADYLWLVIAVAASIVAFFVRSRRWILLMEPLGHKPSLKNTYHAVMTGYLANMLFPRLGEITRCAALGKKENMPFDKLVGTVIIERTIDFLTVLIIMGLMIIYGGSATGTFLSENIIRPLGTKMAAIFGFSSAIYLTIIALLVILFWLAIRHRAQLSQRPLIRRMLDFITGIIDGLKTIATLRRRWEFVILTVVLWSLYLLMSWLPLYCLASTGHLGAGAGLFVLIIGSLGMAVPVQSGVGVYHWIVSRGLAVVYAIPVEQGLAYATISHESQLLLVAILGSISMFALFGRHGVRGLRSVSKE